jgi:hypothetical protein
VNAGCGNDDSELTSFEVEGPLVRVPSTSLELNAGRSQESRKMIEKRAQDKRFSIW